jgi:hypothetical protein
MNWHQEFIPALLFSINDFYCKRNDGAKIRYIFLGRYLCLRKSCDLLSKKCNFSYRGEGKGSETHISKLDFLDRSIAIKVEKRISLITRSRVDTYILRNPTFSLERKESKKRLLGLVTKVINLKYSTPGACNEIQIPLTISIRFFF